MNTGSQIAFRRSADSVHAQDIVVAGPFAEDQSEIKRRGKIVRLDANGFAVEFLY